MDIKTLSVFVSVFFMIAAQDATAYKFLCNGMDANGTVHGDGCGSCTDSNAARWSPAIVSVKYDSQTLPTGVSASEWTNAFNAGLEVWSNVSGSILDLDNGGHSSTREMGNNENAHEVMWILSVNEWRTNIGSSENGTLGVTLPRNYCQGGPQDFRQIVDADMALNGTGAFDWSSSCQGWNCSSMLSTFVHEMGHFVGLDHPCTQCDWAVMSAQAYTEPEAPLLDDQNGLRALYPGVGGGVGYGCDNENDCNTGLECISFNDTSFCSQTCAQDGDCPDGYECTDVNGQDYCTFATGSLAAVVGEGENCYQRRCEEGLVCAGSGGSDYYCYRVCQSDSDCSENQTCMDSGNGENLCVSTSGDGQVGQACGNEMLCAEGLICTGMEEGSYYCRTQCDPDTGAECASNETCFELVGGAGSEAIGACFPMGTIQEGGVCVDPMDCAVGKLCLEDSADGTAHCYQRCDQGHTCTDASQQCVQSQGVAYCTPLLTGGGSDSDDNDDNNNDDNSDNTTTTVPDSDENCNLNRGNWDCPNTHGCQDNGDGDEWGICTEGVYGQYGTGDICETDEDCNSGLCDRGLCTRPCDGNNGCDSTFTCEMGLIPADANGDGAGLCRPVSCASNPDICPGGTTCIYRDTFQRNVCAAGTASGCGCATSSPHTFQPWWLLGMLFVLGVRRRQE